MKPSLALLLLFGPATEGFTTPPMTPPAAIEVICRSRTVAPSTLNDADARQELEDFAVACNPAIQYFDPLQLADQQVIGAAWYGTGF